MALRDFYWNTGNVDKFNWTETEMENLHKSQTFQWLGLPQITPPPKELFAGADQRLLVEYVVAAREEYLSAVKKMAEVYTKKGATLHAQMMRNVLARFRPHETFKYLADAEIPPADLKPMEAIPKADVLFDEGVRLYNSGKNLKKYGDIYSF